MKFIRADYHTIMSGLVVRYTIQSRHPDAGEISASRDGITIQGYWPTFDYFDIEDIASVLKRASEQFGALQGPRPQHALPFSLDPDCVVEHWKPHFAGEPELIASREHTT